MDQKMGVQYEARQSRRRVPVFRTYQLPASEKTYLPQQNLQTVGTQGRKETRLDKLTKSKHNCVSIFSSIVTTVYIISDTDWGTLVLFFNVYLKD